MNCDKKQYIHFSFDDVFECLKDIIVHAGQYKSIFENETFSWMKRMNTVYGAVFSLYTFNQFTGDPDYDISDLPVCYAAEFKENASWLKFGFHAKDDLKKYKEDEPDAISEDYKKFLAAILNATHNDTNCIDRVVRLGFFAGTKMNVWALRDHSLGIGGLLSADDDRLPYYFDEAEAAEVRQRGEIWLDKLLILRSQPRIEGLQSIDALINRIGTYTEPKVIELFTHECCITRTSMVDGYSMHGLCEYLIKWAFENGYGFGFAQDLYEVIDW